MKKSRILSLLLAAALLCGCGAKKTESAAPEKTETISIPAATAAPEPTATPEPTAAPTPEITWSDGVHADVDFDDMTWEIYDTTLFNERCEQLSRTEDAGEAEELYRWLAGEYNKLRTYSELVWIDFYASNGEDDEISDACQQIDDMLSEAGDTLFAALASALEGPVRRELTAVMGEENARSYVGYEEMSERESYLWNRETELELRYNELVDRTDISEPSLNYQLGRIFLDLVKIRNELAELNGYDTYAEYAYEMSYGRDYTPEDAARLCEQIKPYARKYYADCYYCDVFQEDIGYFSAGELIDMLSEYAPRISPEAAAAQRYMEDHGLYLIESMNLISGLGYTTTLPAYNAPFLYNSLYGNVYDVTSMFHEFGHYYDAFVNPEPDPLGSYGSYDIYEIHSTSLEALTCGWYDEIFGEEADKARIYCLDSLIDNVVSGCIYDEFQQYVYAHPDMSPDDVNKAYRDISASYGVSFRSASGAYYWMYVSHNFESPFYYISYAVSTLASLQVWALAEKDRDAAIELYNDIVSRGAFDDTYCELVRDVGLKLFTEDLDACFRDAYAALDDLCRRYDAGLMDAA